MSESNNHKSLALHGKLMHLCIVQDTSKLGRAMLSVISKLTASCC